MNSTPIETLEQKMLRERLNEGPRLKLKPGGDDQGRTLLVQMTYKEELIERTAEARNG